MEEFYHYDIKITFKKPIRGRDSQIVWAVSTEEAIDQVLKNYEKDKRVAKAEIVNKVGKDVIDIIMGL